MVKKINEQEFEQIINVEKKVIVDCYADWCGPCKMLAPIMDEVSNNNQQYDFYKLNVDETNEVSRKYGIMSIPTILIFENGNLKKQIVGFRTKAELEKIINQ